MPLRDLQDETVTAHHDPSRERLSFVGLIILGVLATMGPGACALRPPMVEPLPVTPAAVGQDVVVQVRPLDTSLGSEDRRHYEVDLSAYFSAFLVTIENRTSHPLAIDLVSSTLQEGSAQPREVLTDEELVRTYRHGREDDGAIELVPKAPAVIKRELERIRAVRSGALTLTPGEQIERVLLFSPVAAGCGQSVLTIRGMEIVDEPGGLEFRFPLTTCAAKSDADAP